MAGREVPVNPGMNGAHYRVEDPVPMATAFTHLASRQWTEKHILKVGF